MNIDLRSVVVEEVASGSGERHIEIETVAIQSSPQEGWLKRVTRWALMLTAGLIPIVFWPGVAPALLAKQVLISILVGLAALAWLGEGLLTSEITYRKSWANFALGVLLLGLFLSSLTAGFSIRNFFGPDLLGERFGSFLIFGVLMVLVGSAFRKRERSARLFSWIAAGGILLSLLAVFQIWIPHLIPFADFRQPGTNPIGTVNALAAVLGVYFVLSLGLIAGGRAAVRRRLPVIALFFFSAIGLVLINSTIVWVGIAAASIMLLGYISARRTISPAWGSSARFAMLFLVLAAALFFILFAASAPRISTLPAEVSPSFSSTLQIGKQALRVHPILGFGPGEFVRAYNRFVDPAINQTPFWAVRFNAGSGFLATLVTTGGIIGVLAFVFFLAVIMGIVIRAVTRAAELDPIVLGTGAALSYMAVMWLIYTSSFAMGALFFLLLGLLLVRMESDAASRWDAEERTLKFQTPWAVFAASLLMILLMVSALGLFYLKINQYAAGVYFSRGANRIQAGDLASGISAMRQAVRFDPANSQYQRTLSQALLEEVRRIVSQINAGNTALQRDFQASVSDALKFAKNSAETDPENPDNWAALGFVYQSIVPFIQGADVLALQAYDEAEKRDPVNPSYGISKAATFAALADRAESLRAEAQDQAAKTLLQNQRGEALGNAKIALEKSIRLKSDLPQSNYLLAQILIRQGDLPEAIRQVESLRALAPTDIGVAFQLGVLYYQVGELAKAEAEFLRATGLNPQYSNARYFLGLIYDRRGERERAISEFKGIQALNPENREVETILSNLRARRPALFSIASPTARSAPPLGNAGANPKP